MEKEHIGILIFALLILISSLTFHYKIRNYLVSSVLAALTTSVLFQIIGFIVLGYIDPFFLIAFVITLVISFMASMLVGIPFVLYRKKENINNRVWNNMLVAEGADQKKELKARGIFAQWFMRIQIWQIICFGMLNTIMGAGLARLHTNDNHISGQLACDWVRLL